MLIRALEIRMSDGTMDPAYDEFEMAYVYCEDAESGYCVSLSRCRPDRHIEVMVRDQKCLKSNQVEVELTPTRLRILLSASLAKKLEGIAEYEVQLKLRRKQLRDLDRSLAVIFQRCKPGQYRCCLQE